jgi:hypothetical protein
MTKPGTVLFAVSSRFIARISQPGRESLRTRYPDRVSLVAGLGSVAVYAISMLFPKSWLPTVLAVAR